MSNRSMPLMATLLLALGGCYTYSLVPAESAPEGARVRARVTATEAERLGAILLREDRVLEGRLISTGDELLLEVPSAVTTAGTSMRWLNQRIELSPSDIVELEIRRLDPWRTAGAAAVLAAAVGYAAVQAFEAVGESESEGEKGGTDNFIGISLPFPR